MSEKKIILASSNKGKIKEFSEIFAPYGVKIISRKEAGIYTEPEETGKDFKQNAYIKAKDIFDRLHKPCIADDSGLCVDVLGGAPGVNSHRYSGENASDDENTDLLLKNLEDVPDEKRTARFVCVICYIDINGSAFYAEGEAVGKIARERHGSNGFGYDPVFMYGDRSFAELSADEKNKVSHRGKAIEKFKKMIDMKDII